MATINTLLAKVQHTFTIHIYIHSNNSFKIKRFDKIYLHVHICRIVSSVKSVCYLSCLYKANIHSKLFKQMAYAIGLCPNDHWTLNMCITLWCSPIISMLQSNSFSFSLGRLFIVIETNESVIHFTIQCIV